MHIEKRKSRGKIKYYLSHSYREGQNVHKFRKYLGQNLTTGLLGERMEIAAKLLSDEIHRYRIIGDPLLKGLPAKDIEWVRNIQSKIPITIHHLSEAQWTVFSELFTYHTNAIEGSKLSSDEVKNILEKDRWPEKSKADIAEAYGVNGALKLIRSTKEHLSLDLIKKIHLVVFRNSKPFAGKLRKPGEEVAVMDSTGFVVHQGAPQPRIVYLLNELVAWYKRNRKKYPGLVLAAVVHNQFENIHPFRDGNGRVGRILLNNVLIKHRLPPININFNNRLQYYACLQAYEKEHNLKPTIELFFKEYKALAKDLGDYRKKRM